MIKESLLADAAEEWWKAAKVGDMAMVTYSDDDVGHERVMIWPAGGKGEEGHWWVLTPDHDCYVEDLTGSSPDKGPSASAPLKGGRKVAGIEVYRFRGAPSADHIASLAAEQEKVEDAKGQEYVKPLGGSSKPRRTSTAVVATGSPVGGGMAAAGAVLGHVWVQAEPIGGRGIGSVIDATKSHGVRCGSRGFFEIGGVSVVADLVEVGREKEYRSEREDFLRGVLARPGTVVAEKEPEDRDDPEDGRTLWVDWDAHGERFKEWREVVAESTQLGFGESSFVPDGAPTALHMGKMMYRRGGDPRRWVEIWLREKRLEGSDRTAFELRTLCEIFACFGSFDQCNIGGVLAIEILARRIAGVVDAYSVAARPSWNSSKYYQGTAQSDDVISPTLRAQVLKKSRDDVEVINAQARLAGMRGVPEKDDKGEKSEDGGGDGDGARGRGRGRGRGRSGRTVPGAAASG